MADNIKKKKKKLIRHAVQLLFFLTILLIAINHQIEEKGIKIPFISSASLHSVCPFGGVVSIYKIAAEGSFVQKIHESSLVVLAIVLMSTVFLGPAFCGWICPLGTVQELVGKLGKKIFKKRYNKFIPYKYDKYMRFSRYGVLVWVVYMTAYTGKLIFSEVDPYFALFNFWTSEMAIGGVMVLIVTLTLSLFIERPWCKYACPLGAVLGLSNFFRFFKIRRTLSTCVSCKKCDNTCPMNIQISDKEKITNHQCISCLKCTSEVSCPIDNTLNLKTRGVNNVKIKSIILGILLIVLFFGGIFASDLAGFWKTVSSKSAGVIRKGTYAGQKNPGDIKGSYSFSDIRNNFGISEEVLQSAFRIKDVSDISAFRCKDLETYYGTSIDKEIGTDSVRLFTALYNGIEYEITEDIYLPDTAVKMLKDKGDLSEEQIEYLDKHTVVIP